MAGEAGQAQYRQLAADLRERIEAGEFRPGDRLPTNVELAEATGVTRVTVQQAIKLLKAEGVVETRRGGGTVVSQPLSPLAEALSGPGGARLKRGRFYGLTVGEVAAEIAAAQGSAGRTLESVELIAPAGAPEGAAGIDECGMAAFEKHLSAALRAHEGRADRSGAGEMPAVAPDLAMVQAPVVPGYRVGVMDADDDSTDAAGERVIIYVPGSRGGGLRAVPASAYNADELAAIAEWVEIQFERAQGISAK